jgi:hypothetical protein
MDWTRLERKPLISMTCRDEKKSEGNNNNRKMIDSLNYITSNAKRFPCYRGEIKTRWVVRVRVYISTRDRL